MMHLLIHTMEQLLFILVVKDLNRVLQMEVDGLFNLLNHLVQWSSLLSIVSMANHNLLDMEMMHSQLNI